MGDRAVIEICSPHPNNLGDTVDSLFIYSHWHGKEMYDLLTEVLESCPTERLRDPGYFTRILSDRISKDYIDAGYPNTGMAILVGNDCGPDHEWPILSWNLKIGSRTKYWELEIDYHEETFTVDEWIEKQPHKTDKELV